MHLKEILKINWSVYASCDDDGQCDLEDFLDELPANMEGSRDRLLNIIEQVAENGPQHFKDNISHQIDDNNRIWEFIAGRIRVLWFYDSGKIIVCSHGFIKKTQGTPKKEKQKAINLRKEYLLKKNT